jgi:alkanesulfonate monooxygenase SsuD/methylene tetrahydromethanopterin reductase-like flavin-dependent oxidoreductase (luciferase family)
MQTTSTPHAVSPVRPKIGLQLPHWDALGGTPAPRWPQIQSIALAAADVGVDSIWVADHLIRYWESCSLLAALAAVTRRVEVGVLVMATSFRNPALVAKMADTVDEISGGRLILGLGAGYREAEYRAFGYPYDHRASRFEEAIQIISALLTTGTCDVQGTYYSARECELRPRGTRPGGPPILVGTDGPRMLRLTARYADMWNGFLAFDHSVPSAVPPLRAAVDAACEAVGRDPATLTRTLTVRVELADDSPYMANPFDEAVSGSVEEIAARFWEFADEGIDHLIVFAAAEYPATIETLGRVIELMDHGR